ncbi:MAG: ABC transporter ATP-binding protein/permease [archaeon]|nr:ABC transporter ATP-binding protein/permease [archaeon]MCR4323755.1 ABC transporter ATP-binding protein/permease [Nanoarchaeota archaeon]
MKEETKNRKNPLWILVKTEWQSLGKRKPIFFLYMTLFVIAGAISLLNPLVVGLIFNTIQNEITTEADLWRLIGYIMLILVIEVGFWVFHSIARVLEIRTGFYVGKNYTNKKIQRIIDLPIEWHKDHHSGDTIDKINKSSGAVKQYSMHTSFQILNAIIRLVGSVVVLLFFDLTAALVALVFTFLVLFVITRIDRILVKKYRERNKLENKAAAAIYDYISNIFTVVTLRLRKIVRKEIDNKLEASYPLQKEIASLSEFKWAIAGISIQIMVVVLLSLKAYRDFTTTGIILIGTLYILYSYLQRMGETFYSLAWLYGDILKMGANVENIEPIDIEYMKIKNTLDGNLEANWKKIDLKGIEFTYGEEGKEKHMDNIDFSFKRGEKIALVGESGSGKSTLLTLLRGLYDSGKGEVYCDGVLLKKGFNKIRKHVTLIPQDPEIFNNTIGFNVTMGLSYSNKDVQEAIKMARFSKVIDRLEKGLETNVMEKGVSLSGGEKQRLALARGLLAAYDSDIVLMDEPTSSVDSLNELKIHEEVFKAFKDKTIISSIHRLHLLDKFDKICFLERGKILASGTLDEMKRFPKFNRLLKKYKSVKD